MEFRRFLRCECMQFNWRFSAKFEGHWKGGCPPGSFTSHRDVADTSLSGKPIRRLSVRRARFAIRSSRRIIANGRFCSVRGRRMYAGVVAIALGQPVVVSRFVPWRQAFELTSLFVRFKLFLHGNSRGITARAWKSRPQGF